MDLTEGILMGSTMTPEKAAELISRFFSRRRTGISPAAQGVYYCHHCDVFTDDQKKHNHDERPLD
jgi:hypothetical protein